MCTDRLFGRRHHKSYGFRQNPIEDVDKTDQEV